MRARNQSYPPINQLVWLVDNRPLVRLSWPSGGGGGASSSLAGKQTPSSQSSKIADTKAEEARAQAHAAGGPTNGPEVGANDINKKDQEEENNNNIGDEDQKQQQQLENGPPLGQANLQWLNTSKSGQLFALRGTSLIVSNLAKLGETEHQSGRIQLKCSATNNLATRSSQSVELALKPGGKCAGVVQLQIKAAPDKPNHRPTD